MNLQTKTPWYKEPWPWILMAGPGIVIVAGVITTWIAFSGADGLVEDDYYKQGLEVNQRKLRDAEATRSALFADVVLGPDQKTIELDLQQSKGADVLPRSPLLNFRLAHPTRAGMDQNVVLVRDGDGRYRGELASRLVGRWYVSIDDVTMRWRLVGEWNFDKGGHVSLRAGHGAETTGGH